MTETRIKADISPFADPEARKMAEEIAEQEEKLKGRVKDYKVINRALPRVDGVEKATGRAIYTGDIQLPGMLYARMIRSTRMNARIKEIHIEKALAYPGVKGIITYKDAPKDRDNMFTWSNMYKAINLAKSEMPFLSDHVRYVGEPIGAVAAVHEAQAEEAVKLVEVEYEDLPAVTDMYEAMDPDSPLVHEGGNQAGFPGPIPVEEKHPPYLLEWGDIDKGFAEADIITESTFQQPRNRFAATIEPPEFIARWEGDRLVAYVSSQGVHSKKHYLATWLGLPLNKVRVISPYVGGAFGSKAGPFQEHAIIALLAKKIYRPIRWTLGVGEYGYASRPVEASEITAKVGMKKDGTITALKLNTLANSGAYADVTPTLIFVGLNETTELFRVQNVHMEGKLMYTNTIPTGGMRGFGIVQPHWATMVAVNKAITELGINPLDHFLNNCTTVGDRIWVMRAPQIHSKTRESIVAVADAAGWREKWHKPGIKRLPNGRMHGLGLSFTPYACGSLWIRPAIVLVESNEDGTFKIVTGASELGSGQRTAFAMLAAEVLKMSPDDFEILTSDTAATPYDTEQTGNRSTQYVGNALVLACEDAKQQLLHLGSILLKTPAEELDLVNKMIVSTKDPQKAIPVSEALIAAPFAANMAFTVVGRGVYTVPPNITFSGPIAIVAEVEVDTETGEVFIPNIWQAGDTGVPINLLAVDSQALGSTYFGVGVALSEELFIDPRTQQLLNPHPSPWYPLPTINEVEDMHPFIIVESYFPLGPLGAKGGTSEGAMYCIPHALSMAIHNATGAWVEHVPVTPEKMLKALGKVREE